MEVGGTGAVVTGETFAIVPAGKSHSFTGAGDNALLILDLPGGDATPRDLHGLWDRADALPFVAMDPALANYCRFLAAEMERFGPAGIDRFHASALLIDAIARRVEAAAPRLPAALARALKLASGPADEPPSLNELAAAAGVSPATLHRLFLDRFGQPPARFLTRLRLEYAAKALAETDLPIAEIAFRAGYKDQSAFTRAFRKTLGTPPASFRGRNA